MQGLCLLYQLPHNEIIEKSTGDTVEMLEQELTPEVSAEFPEFEANGMKIGQKVKIPTIDRSNVEIRKSFIMEADFIAPDGDFEIQWTRDFAEMSPTLIEGSDHEATQYNHIRWFLSEGWEYKGLAGAVHAFTKDIYSQDEI